MSLPKDDVQSIDDLEFDALIKKTMFRAKSKTSLEKIVFNQKRFQDLVSNNIPQVPNPLRVMAAIFPPFIFPSQLHDLPQNYSQRINIYNAKGNVSSQKHLDWFNDFIDLEEVDYEDVKLRFFT
jgi:hypothetical protein